jgi:hypothetical protein
VEWALAPGRAALLLAHFFTMTVPACGWLWMCNYVCVEVVCVCVVCACVCVCLCVKSFSCACKASAGPRLLREAVRGRGEAEKRLCEGEGLDGGEAVGGGGGGGEGSLPPVDSSLSFSLFLAFSLSLALSTA